MPAKDAQPEQLSTANPEAGQALKKIERFLRLLTWQMFFLLALLLYYLALHPQAGRYQFTVAGEDVVVFDTASSRAVAIKLQKEVVSSPQNPPPSAPAPAQGPATPAQQ